MTINIYIGKDSQKKTFVTLVNEHCCPVCPYISIYFNIHLSGVSFNSQHLYAQQMKFALQYFDSKGIDLTQRAKSGTFLNRAEIDAFVTACKFKQSSEFTNVVSINFHSDKSIQNAIHAGAIAKQKVKATTARGRINRLRDYLLFLFTVIHADHVVPEQVTFKYKFVLTQLANKAKALRDFNTTVVTHGESLLPNEQFIRLLEVIKPSSQDNPFKSAKLRNYLIVALLINTGIRRGALAKLKVGDCKFWGSFDEISITKAPDDQSDPRRFRPSQKTRPHKSYLPKPLMQELKKYIDEVRCRFPASDNHEMIFVSEKNSQGTAGQPISLSSIDKIFSKLSQVIGFKVHAHLLRHKWNELFTEFAEAKGMDYEQQEKLRKFSMGWDRASKMNELYNEMKIFQQTKAHQKARQDHMTKEDAK
jgi:integrase